MRALLVALLLSLPVSAQPSSHALSVPARAPSDLQPSAHAAGRIESTADIADPVFRVHAKLLGLDRSVEMLQWRKVVQPTPLHFEMAWTAERIDSTGFDASHRNARDFPFNGERWWSAGPMLDGHPVSPEVLGMLQAWEPLKPDLTQLPTNLAVSFQPDGDWLSTSQDPAHPQIGDLRVRWRAITNAVAPAGLALVAGRWEPEPVATVRPAAPAHPVASLPTTPSPPRASNPDSPSNQSDIPFIDRNTWIMIGGAVVFGILVALLWRRVRTDRPSPSRKDRPTSRSDSARGSPSGGKPKGRSRKPKGR